MKTKRCTNSSCRKTFRTGIPICPHCGKQYPRQASVLDKNGRYTVVLTYWGISKLAVIKVLRKHTNLGLRDAKTITDNIPSLVSTGIQRLQAEALKADIRAVGGDAMILPAGRGTKGIFVLPKRAG